MLNPDLSMRSQQRLWSGLRRAVLVQGPKSCQKSGGAAGTFFAGRRLQWAESTTLQQEFSNALTSTSSPEM